MKLAAVIMLLLASPAFASPPEIGANCAISAIGGTAPLAITPRVAGEVAKSLRENDKENFDALVAGGKVRVVQRSSRGRILDRNPDWSAVKLRVLDGPMIGLEGWLSYALCK